MDASVIEAHASRFQRVEGSEVEWTDEQRASRPVREYLAALDGAHAPTNPERKPKSAVACGPGGGLDHARAAQGDVRLQPQRNGRSGPQPE